MEIKETKKSWIVDIDTYIQRQKYYTGTRAGVVIRIDKNKQPFIFSKFHNDNFDTFFDALLYDKNNFDNLNSDDLPAGIYFYRKGYIVQ